MDRSRNWLPSSLSPSRQSPISELAIKRLLVEDKSLDNRLAAVKKSVDDVRKSSSITKLEIALIDQKLAVFDAEARLKQELKKLKMKNILGEECKRFEWEMKKNQAEMILEKEEKTLAIHYERMKKSEERYETLWKGVKERNEVELNSIAKAKESEGKRIETLKDEIQRIYETEEFSEDVEKIRQDVMILKKRNAAILLRLTKKAEHLEEQLTLRKGCF